MPLHAVLNIKKESDCRWDLVSLGEILLRFDPEDRRIHNSRQFTVWDGGAEYNVASNLSRVFRQRTTVVTALADNAIGRLAEDLARGAGVDVSNINWRDPKAAGTNTRNGIYFIERGFGLRAPSSAFDRANTAVSQLAPGDIDWLTLYETDGCRWFHTGGVFTGLSESTPAVAIEALKAAKAAGSVTSYDLNYRASLWANRGGMDAANIVNRNILPFVDVVFGTFGFDSRLSHFSRDAFASASQTMMSHFPNLRSIVSSLRETHSASRHDLGGVCFIDGEIHRSRDHKNIDVLDRVGSGDAFASSFIYSLLEGRSPQFAIDCAAAHGALAMTTPGDGSMATLAEITALMEGGDAGAKR